MAKAKAAVEPVEAQAPEVEEGEDPVEVEENESEDENDAEENTEGNEQEEASVYTALFDAVAASDDKFVAQPPHESDKDFLTRLVSGVAEISQEAFDELPVDAQSWFNATADAMNESKEWTPPEGFVSNYNADAKPPTRSKLKAGRPAGPAKEKAPPKPKEPRPKAPSVFIRELVLADPKAGLAVLKEQLSKLGIEAGDSTITTIRYDTIATLKVAQAAGKLTGVELPT